MATAYFDHKNRLQVSNDTDVKLNITVEYIDFAGDAALTTVSVDAGKTEWSGVTGGPDSNVISVRHPVCRADR